MSTCVFLYKKYFHNAADKSWVRKYVRACVYAGVRLGPTGANTNTKVFPLPLLLHFFA